MRTASPVFFDRAMAVTTAALLMTMALVLGSQRALADERTWKGTVSINPASDMVDDGGPECRDGRIGLAIQLSGASVEGRLTPMGHPGAPGLSEGPISLTGRYDQATDSLALRSTGNDVRYNSLTGTLRAGTWRNSACWGEYRLAPSG